MIDMIKKIIVTGLALCLMIPSGYVRQREIVSKAASIVVTAAGGQYYCTECGYTGTETQHQVTCKGSYVQDSYYFCFTCCQKFTSEPGSSHTGMVDCLSNEAVGWLCITCSASVYDDDFTKLEHDTSEFKNASNHYWVRIQICSYCGKETVMSCRHETICPATPQLCYLSSYTCSECKSAVTTPSETHTKLCSGVMLPYVKVSYDNQGGSGKVQTFDQIYGNPMPAVEVPVKKYTVTLDANGGTCNLTVLTAEQIFKGYYDALSGTKYINENGKSDKNSDLTEDTTLYAQWENTNVTLPAATNGSRTFVGWSTAQTEEHITAKAGESYTPSQDITLYAIYTVSGSGADYNKEYDGAAHGIDIECESGCTVAYGTEKGNYDLTIPPQYTDVGTYTVYWKISKEGYAAITGENKVVISKANPQVVYPELSHIAYGQKVSDSTMANGKGDGIFTFETPNEILSEGTHFVSIRFIPSDTKNYNSVSTTCELTVDEAPEEATEPPEAEASEAPEEATEPPEAEASEAPEEATEPPEAEASEAPEEATALPEAEASEAPEEATEPSETDESLEADETSEPDENMVPLISGNSKKFPVITISKKIRVGDSYRLKDTGAGITVYKSSKNKIAGIVHGNMIKARKKGNCFITATIRKSGKVKYKLKIRLHVVGKKDSSYIKFSQALTKSQKKYAGLKMLVSDIAMKKGTHQKLCIDKKGYTVKYKTTNKKVARAVKGRILACKKGNTSIIVQLKKGNVAIRHIINIKVIK